MSQELTRPGRPRRLRLALLLYVGAPLAGVVGIGWFATTARVEAMAERAMQEEVALVARTLQLPVGRALERGDTDRLWRSLQDVEGLESVYGAYVYDTQGDVVAALGNLPGAAESPVPGRAARGDLTGEYGRLAGRRIYSYFVPLMDVGGRVSGVLQVTRRRRDFDDDIRQLRLQAAGVLVGAAVLVVFVVSWGHHRALGRDVERLASDMSRVRSGDRGHRASPAGVHEIRTLAQSLNAMLDGIHTSQEELDRQREIGAALEVKLHDIQRLAALGELAGGVAGELGPPLRVIQERVQLTLADHTLEDEERSRLEDVRTQARRMAGVVRHLIELGRERSADGDKEWVQFQELAGDEGFHGLLGRSRPMQRLFAQIAQVARGTGPVLVVGESGTGKELVARAVHAESRRAGGSFVAVNCAGLPESLIESEFFGHTAGAFTGAARARSGLFVEGDGGTVLLDEIADLPLLTQATLLRVLQEGSIRAVGADRERPIDVRIVAATHRDLEEEVRRGTVREDLFFRLETLTIHVPPLRARGEDVELLAGVFLTRCAARAGKEVRGISPQALERLRHYPFPGNVRELQNAIERAVTFCEGTALQLEHLPARIRSATSLVAQAEPEPFQVRVDPVREDRWPTLDDLGSWYIRRVLAHVGGNKRRAAEILGIGRRTLYRRLDQSAAPSSHPPLSADD